MIWNLDIRRRRLFATASRLLRFRGRTVGVFIEVRLPSPWFVPGLAVEFPGEGLFLHMPGLTLDVRPLREPNPDHVADILDSARAAFDAAERVSVGPELEALEARLAAKPTRVR